MYSLMKWMKYKKKFPIRTKELKTRNTVLVNKILILKNKTNAYKRKKKLI